MASVDAEYGEIGLMGFSIDADKVSGHPCFWRCAAHTKTWYFYFVIMHDAKQGFLTPRSLH